MLFNTVSKIDTSTCMIHNIRGNTSCLVLLLLLFMINSTLGIIANIHAHNSIITPGTTRIIEISMAHAIISSIIIHTGIDRCRTVFTTTTITVVVTITTITMIAINTSIIIITSTRLLLLLLQTVF